MDPRLWLLTAGPYGPLADSPCLQVELRIPDDKGQPHLFTAESRGMEDAKAAEQHAALGLLHQLGALVASLFRASEVLSDAAEAQVPTRIGNLFSVDTMSREVPASRVVEAAVSAAFEVKADLSDSVALSAWCVFWSVKLPFMWTPSGMS